MNSIAEIPKLGPRDAGSRVGAAEFALADFVPPYRYERVGGRLVVLEPRSASHRELSRPFRFELGGYWGAERSAIDDVVMPCWIATSDDDDRCPDICVYLAGKLSHVDIPRRVPELVFEFVSLSRTDQERDYIDKRAEYHAIGVKEYVIVDRFKDAALVLTWQPGDYAERTLTATDTYTTPHLPGLSIPLKDAFNPPLPAGDTPLPNPPTTSP